MNDNLRLQPMNVAFVCNNRYVKYVSVTMVSILQNHPNLDIHFYLICNDISERSRKYIDELRKLYTFGITFLTVNTDEFAEIKNSHNAHISNETNFRYFIADLLPGVDKLLFLDGDLVVDAPLEDMYNINIEKYLVAVAKDPLDRGLKGWFEKFHIPLEYPYLNTGVFLVNMKKWRDLHLSEKLIQAARQWGELFWFPDQDAINVLCYDKNFLIDQKYNFCCELHWDNLEDRARAEKNAVIYHWAGPRKPWIIAEGSYADIFWKYARLSPFYEEILYENIKVSPKKNIRQITHPADMTIIRDMANYRANRINYYRTKLLATFSFGKKRLLYTHKEKELKQKMERVHGYLKN